MGFPGSSAGKKKKKKSTCNVGDPYLIPGFGTSAGEGMDRLPTPVFLGFCGGSAGKDSACKAGDLSLIPELAISPGEGNGYPIQHSGLENSKDWGCKELDMTERVSLSDL